MLWPTKRMLRISRRAFYGHSLLGQRRSNNKNKDMAFWISPNNYIHSHAQIVVLMWTCTISWPSEGSECSECWPRWWWRLVPQPDSQNFPPKFIFSLSSMGFIYWFQWMTFPVTWALFCLDRSLTTLVWQEQLLFANLIRCIQKGYIGYSDLFRGYCKQLTASPFSNGVTSFDH